MHHPLPLRLQALHQVERYPVVDLNIGVNDTLRCDIMALPKQIHPTTLLIPQLDARFHKHTFKTHVIGITAHDNLRNTRHSPCKRSNSLKANLESDLVLLQVTLLHLSKMGASNRINPA